MNNRYTIHNKIGQGGMGVVYRATDRLTREIVALKQIHMPTKHLKLVSSLDTATDRTLRVALAQEFQILSGLRHPHIVSVLDYGFDAKQQPFFTMTYLPNAQTILDTGATFDTAPKVELIQQTLQALAYLHRRGIIHRDLKPSNVLVNAQMVQVLDFGLSVRGGPSHISLGGSVRYMAPELLRREKASKASDLYAVGVMAFELFAGRHPFNVNSGKFAHQVQHDDPDLSLLGLDDALAEVIGRLLAKRPQDRYSSARVCLNAISEALGEPVSKESEAIRESYLQAATFVGRNAEMAQLKAALKAARDNQGAVCLIGGESGVGKSRLLDEFRAHALVAGWQTVVGQTVAEGGSPYQPWREIVPNLVLNCELSDLEAGVLWQVAPSIDRILGRTLPEAPELSGQAAQQRLVLTLVALLQRQPQPTLLLLEDLQWAWESLAPLKQILKVIDQLPQVVVIGTYRDDERPELPEELAGSQKLVLDRLSVEQIEALSLAMLGEAASTQQVVELVAQETEGNTFFIVEVMRALAEEAGQLGEVGDIVLPAHILTSGMQSLLQQRIQKVPLADQGLLQLAAVAGRQLDSQLLQFLAPDEDIKGWLQRIAEMAVLTIRNDQWQFAHDKLRETILADLAADERTTLHRQVAEAIENVYPDDENYYQALLAHWHQAGNVEKEMHYLPVTAQQLIEITADYDQAIELLDRGLLHLSADDNRRVALLNWLAQSHSRQSNYNQAHKLAQQAQELAQQVDDQPGLAKSLENLGLVARDQGNYEQALDYHQQSLTIMQAIGDQLGIGISLNNLGLVASEQGDFKQARDHYQQSLAIMQTIRDQLGIGFSLNNLGLVTFNQGNFEQALDYHQQSLSIRRAIGDQWGIGMSFNNLGRVAYRMGSFSQAHDYYQQSLSIRRAIGDQRGISMSLNNLGLVARNQGNYDQALDYHQQCLAIQQVIGYQRGIGISLNNLGLVAYEQGNFEQALDYHQQSLSIRRAIGDQLGISSSLNNLGLVARHQGNYEQARDYHQQSLTIKQANGDQRGIGISLNNLGLVAYEQGNYEQALDYYQQSHSIYRAIRDQRGICTCLNNLGLVNLKLRREPTHSLFREALTIAQALQTTPLILESLVGFAWHYLMEEHLSRAAELVGLIQHHPARTSNVQKKLDAFLPQLEDVLTPAELQVAMERGKGLDSDMVVETLLNRVTSCIGMI